MTSKVLSFGDKKERKIEQRRREFERIVFQNILGCYSVLDGGKELFSVNIVDISEKGLLIEVPKNWEANAYKIGDELKLRLYFSRKMYLGVLATVRHIQDPKEVEGDMRSIGCEFDTNQQSYEALKAFTLFISKFAEHSRQDKEVPQFYSY